MPKRFKTTIVGAKYNDSPTEDVFNMFEKDKEGRVILTPEATLERAKIAHQHGFLVDPVTGHGFWVAGNLKDVLATTRPKEN